MVETTQHVGQDSRRTARVPVGNQLEKLEEERSKLIVEKRGLERQLHDVEDERKSKNAQLLMKRLANTARSDAVCELNAEMHLKKSPLLRELKAIDERVFAINTRLGEKSGRKSITEATNQSTEVLLRIEKLLSTLVKQGENKG